MLLDRVDLAALIRDAAAGRFPPVDGRVSRTTPWRPGVEAAIAFTGHAVLAVGDDVSDEQLLRLGVHGFGGAHDPRATAALAGRGEIGVLDVLLVGSGTGTTRPEGSPAGGTAVDTAADVDTAAGAPLVPRPDLAATERVRHAAQWRDDVRVLGLLDPAARGVATLSRGIAGLTEVGIQTDRSTSDGTAGDRLAGDAAADDGMTARDLLAGARRQLPKGELLLASVTPGNARSLRFFLRQGFLPIGSVQQWHPDRHRPTTG